MTDGGDGQSDRRSFLRAATAVGASAGLAGCSFFLPSGDGDGTPTETAANGGAGDGTGGSTPTDTPGPTPTDTPDPTPTATRSPTPIPGGGLPFREWVPATSRLDDIDDLQLLYRDIPEIRSSGADDLLVDFAVDAFGVDQFAVTDNMRIYGAPESGELDDTGPLVILIHVGDFDPRAVGNHLLDNGATESRTHRGYQFYEGLNESSGVITAVSESEILAALSEFGVLQTSETIETFLDTHAGDGERFVATSTGYRSIVEGLDDPHYMTMNTRGESFRDGVSDATAWGMGWTFLGAETELVVRWVFQSDRDADRSGVTSWAEGRDGLDTYDYDVTTQGHVVELRGTTRTSQFDALRPGTPTP